MDQIRVNVGPLNSFNNLVYHLAPKFQEIRNAYFQGSTPDILFDFKDLSSGSIGISGLTALLSSTKKLRDFVGHPIKAIMPWNPSMQSFLADIGFFELVTQFSIFTWEGGTVGGYQTGKTNPNNKIICYKDVLPIKTTDESELGLVKALHKQKIAPNFLLRCAKIFDGFDAKLQSIVTNTSLELIINSLIHGEEIAFVGVQRTSKRITITVCDSGIGFPKSLSRTYPSISNAIQNSHINGMLFGCLAQKKEHGLRLAINEVLNYDETTLFNDINQGWAIVSSYDSEIRWQKANWGMALRSFEKINISTGLDPSYVIGLPLTEYADMSRIEKGYWKRYGNFLLGTRVTFEIPLIDDY